MSDIRTFIVRVPNEPDLVAQLRRSATDVEELLTGPNRPVNSIERLVATAVRRAVELREGSYDQAAADLASKTEACVDFGQFYGISREEACEQACAEGPGIGLGCLVYLALDSWWNDTMDWANDILDPTGTTVPTTATCQHGVEFEPELIGELEEQQPDEWSCAQCKANYERTEHEELATEAKS